MPADTAVTPVNAADVAGSVVNTTQAAMHDLSMWGMFMQADLVVKSVMIMLLFASFWSWAIMIDKYMRFKTLRILSAKFEKEFWSAGMIDKFYDRIKKRGNHPLVHVFTSGMEEWLRSRDEIKTMDDNVFSIGVRERVSQMMSITRNREMEKLEKGLSFLGTVGSAAPFVGLFGTVWGIMNSFTQIAASKNTTLAVVAPGIAEALLATAIGLFAAIPAVMGYNKFIAEVDNFSQRMEDFSAEFSALLSRQLDSEGK